MSFWVLCLLCIVQGVCEFLPISSSGHLTLIEQVCGVQGDLLFLNLFLHLASLIAVIVVYRKIILKLIKKPFQPLTYKILISTIFTVILAFIFEVFSLDDYSYKIYCFGFLLTSILLWILDYIQKKMVGLKQNGISYRDAVIVGLVQGIAVIPGLSRSGSTIFSLMLCGNEKDESAEYSFLLSVPIIVGGFVLKLLKMNKEPLILENFTITMGVFAFLFTLLISIISLKLTIKLLREKKFKVFSIYTFILFIITFYINYLI